MRRFLLGPFAAILICLGLDAALFRTHLYPSVLEPDSSTGLFELILRRERLAQRLPNDHYVLTLGNSRFAYARRIIDRLPGTRRFTFRDAGVAGSDPRVWYYMLRDLDPTGQRYRALILGMDDYDDEDRPYDPANEIRDLHYLAVRLRLTDIPEFVRSFEEAPLRWQVLRSLLFKGLIFQRDIAGFLSHPYKRIEYVRLCHEGYASWAYDYVETDRTMEGLAIDWSNLKVTFPASAGEDQFGTVNSFLAHPPDPPTGKLAAYRLHWLGRIVDRYRGSRTKIVFIRLPRGPIPRPDGLSQKPTHTLRQLGERPNVLLMNEHAFEPLEQPALFKDGMHLNREGIARFSVMLSDEVERLLSESGAGWQPARRLPIAATVINRPHEGL